MVKSTDQSLESSVERRLEITPQIKSNLSETSKWTIFMALVGFVCLVFIIIAALYMGIVMNNRTSELGSVQTSPLLIATLYLIVSALIALPLLRLYQFAQKLKKALKSSDQKQLAHSFQQLTACHRMIGFIIAGGLVLYLGLFLSTFFS